jgi:ubiquitin-associated SH3 domain-containing protein
MAPTDLIVYACPIGPLSAQIEAFYAASLAQCGPNSAHAYPPHITLTGFFHDEPAAVPRYVSALGAAHERAIANGPAEITISDLLLRPDFLAFTLVSPWLEALAADFAASVAEPLTRQDAIRLKNWLHLSLAYGYAEQQFLPLKALVEQHIDRSAPVAWELRFYERQPNTVWVCHGAWSL